MPEFQRKTVRLQHKGMQWNTPVDAIPETQICYAENTRVLQQGTVESRPGLTDWVNLGGGGRQFIHSIAVLNNYNPDLANFTKAFVLAVNQGGLFNQFYVGDTPTHLVDNTLNPIRIPVSTNNVISGNPVTYVDMAPVGTNLGWKYIGDQNINFEVGYYPGDSSNTMARGITMGITPPVNTNIPVVAEDPPGTPLPGPLNGGYQWVFAYRNKWTGARSNPSAPTRVSIDAPKLVVTNGVAQLQVPSTPIDPQTTNSDLNILIDIYRAGGTLPDYRYVGTADGPGNSLFFDNLGDNEIATAPLYPGVLDPITNVYRANLYRPFVAAVNAVYSANVDTLNQRGNGTWILNSAANQFDVNWIPGGVISIDNGIYHIFQVISSAQLELVEDVSASLSNNGHYAWATPTGTLKAGCPLPHIWGPYGTGGVAGAYIFGCGGSHADSGTLYWTNGNDPDSADIANSLIVTSPSEPLRGGCIYDGTPFVFSTERIFRIYPAAQAGQFTVQEVPGGKGLWAEYSLTVQSTGNPADQSITWVGKDGIYDWSTSAGLVSLTDRDLYPFFPHDNQPGVSVETLFPFLPRVGSPSAPVNGPDYSPGNMKYHRLCWFMGELFYDFVCIGPGGVNVYNTLVFDSKQAQGWVSLDQYASTSAVSSQPVCRGIEIGGNNMKVAVGYELMDYTGHQDVTTPINCSVFTRQDDLGDPRIRKLYGDYMIDAAAGDGGGITVIPFTDVGTNELAASYVNTVNRTQEVTATLPSGLGVLGTSFGLYFSWLASPNTAALYQYEYTYVPKPILTGFLATDKTDDGYLGAKYLRGLCIECNTLNTTRTVNVLIDDAVVATLTVLANGQQELPFAITPAVGSMFQLQPTDPNSWELFSIRWVWEKWPDLTTIESTWMDLGTTKPKYIRAFTIPVAGLNGPDLGFTVYYNADGTVDTYVTTPVAPYSLTAKTALQYSFSPPILAHQLKLVPSTSCRIWYDEIKWDAEEWPEIARLYGPIENLGTSQAKYIRGFSLPIETNGNPVVMSLIYDNESVIGIGNTVTLNFTQVTTDTLSKNVFPYTPTPPIIAHELQLRSLQPARFWYNEVKWDFEVWPEYDTGRTPWLNGGTVSAKFVRGITIPLDTGGQPISLDLMLDTGQTIIFGPFNTAAGSKTSVYCVFNVPLIMHEFQILPQSQCRIWYEEIKWDAEEWPELEVESTPWLDNGTPSAKYIRGVTFPIETNGQAVTFDLYTDTGQQVPFGPFTTAPGVKTSVYCSFTVPLVIHQFRIQPRTPARVWYDPSNLKWDADPWPETETESSAWTDCGYQGAKFMQGLTIPMDTGGQPVSFQVTYDGVGSPQTIGPFTTPAGQKSTMAYSFPVPFICHNLQVTPLSPCAWFQEEVKWVWEPEPELVTTYTTQPTDHDLPGYNYLFDCYIAYIGSADAPNFTVTTEYGSITYSLPVSNNVYTRAYLLLNPQKSKWKSYSITSSQGIRLYLKDCEVRVKNWTDKGNYPSAFTSHMPFGAESRMVGARI